QRPATTTGRPARRRRGRDGESPPGATPARWLPKAAATSAAHLASGRRTPPPAVTVYEALRGLIRWGLAPRGRGRAGRRCGERNECPLAAREKRQESSLLPGK